jgi:hypothetical protein
MQELPNETTIHANHQPGIPVRNLLTTPGTEMAKCSPE